MQSMTPKAILAIAALLVATACNTYNFSHPLPLDKPSMPDFPVELRGQWLDSVNDQHYFISRQYGYLIAQDTDKIVRGVWPHPNPSGGYDIAPFSYRSLSRSQYDSVKMKIDTLPNYLLRKTAIFKVDAQGYLENGYPYIIENDTLVAPKMDTLRFDLGNNAVLRKLTNSLYVLNVKNNVFNIPPGRDAVELNSWWQIVLLRVMADGNIRLYVPGNKMEKDPSVFYDYQDNYYLDADWTGAAMMHLLGDSSFRFYGEVRRQPGLAIVR